MAPKKTLYAGPIQRVWQVEMQESVRVDSAKIRERIDAVYQSSRSFRETRLLILSLNVSNSERIAVQSVLLNHHAALAQIQGDLENLRCLNEVYGYRYDTVLQASILAVGSGRIIFQLPSIQKKSASQIELQAENHPRLRRNLTDIQGIVDNTVFEELGEFPYGSAVSSLLQSVTPLMQRYSTYASEVQDLLRQSVQASQALSSSSATGEASFITVSDMATKADILSQKMAELITSYGAMGDLILSALDVYMSSSTNGRTGPLASSLNLC